MLKDEIQIIYEDESVVVVNKPAGILVHPTHVSKDEVTVVDWFCEKYPESSGVGEKQKLVDGSEISRPGVVHRLDKDTSGVLILAKTQEAHAHLKKQFQEHSVRKQYCALVHGVPRFEEITIDKPISKHPKDFRRFTSGEGRGESREAQTKVVVKERFDKYALVDAYPKTGRTHQIRVHLSGEGFPVACDKLYGRGRECPAPLDRQALHALAITFVSPATGGEITVEAPLSLDISQAIDNLRRAC
jgi:23S rRNA pseudouridine1911/1915/1917 synthase